jgi:hypothetical protein
LAQSTNILIDVDISRVRSKVRAVIRDAQDANRELAQLEERLGTLGSKLAPFHIGLKIGDHA